MGATLPTTWIERFLGVWCQLPLVEVAAVDDAVPAVAVMEAVVDALVALVALDAALAVVAFVAADVVDIEFAPTAMQPANVAAPSALTAPVTRRALRAG